MEKEHFNFITIELATNLFKLKMKNTLTHKDGIIFYDGEPTTDPELIGLAYLDLVEKADNYSVALLDWIQEKCHYIGSGYYKIEGNDEDVFQTNKLNKHFKEKVYEKRNRKAKKHP